MKKSIFISSVVGLMLFPILVNAQEQQSMVVMSEAQIASLTAVLRKYKKQQTEMIYVNEDILFHNNEAMPKTTFELDYLRQQITLLEARLQKNVNNNEATRLDSDDDYSRNFSSQHPRNTSGTNVVVVPSSKKDVDKVNLSTSSESDKEAYAALVAKLDSLYALTLRSSSSSESTKLDLMKLNRQDLEASKTIVEQPNYDIAFADLQNRMEALRATIEVKKNVLTEYDILKAKYKGFKREIYFANNATRLSPEAQQIVNTIYEAMEGNDHLDIIVKGFASDVGNARYNEQLSMQRTEAVKRALMLRGIHPTRVLTQHHGIDYNAINSESARRVELSFLVRR